MRNNKHCGKEFSRRGFLRGICAASMAAGVPGRMWGAAARVGMPDLRIGVLSDIHLSYDKNGFRENPQSEMQGVFIKALEYFRDRHVDGVLVCGDVKGYKFILSHFVNTAPGATVDLDKYMAKYGSDSSKPVFYSQHRWMKGTYCTDDDMWGADSGGQKPILDRYPNCVAFTGHTHYMLTDDRTVGSAMREWSSTYMERMSFSNAATWWEENRLDPAMIEKHFSRKHGPNAYYGQPGVSL